MKSLYKMCAGHTLLPGSLNFELPGNTMGDVRYRGWFADVLRRDSHGKDVAVKVLQARGLSLEEMKSVSLHKQTPTLVHVGELSAPFAEVLQGSYNLEFSSPSECAATARGDHGGEPVRHGF